MSEDAGTGHRRRRRRATAAQGAPEAQEPRLPRAVPMSDPGAPEPSPPAPVQAQQRGDDKSSRRSRPQRDAAERGMRDLVGAGKSQIGVSGALRGRDVNRPTDDDLAEAEDTVVIVRRSWQPSDRH